MTGEPLRSAALSVTSLTLEPMWVDGTGQPSGGVRWTATLTNGPDTLTCTGTDRCPFGFPMTVRMTLEAP